LVASFDLGAAGGQHRIQLHHFGLVVPDDQAGLAAVRVYLDQPGMKVNVACLSVATDFFGEAHERVSGFAGGIGITCLDGGTYAVFIKFRSSILFKLVIG
jgi:hypothetical protein